MKAMRLARAQPIEERPLQLVDLPPPIPGRGEVRMRVEACGICRTDLHIIEGDLSLPKLPVVPGHQIVGVVDQVGAGVTRFREGDRLGIPWLFSTCGQCLFCQRNQENLCDAGKAKKVALTACMRKLLTMLNAMVKHRTPWENNVAHSS